MTVLLKKSISLLFLFHIGIGSFAQDAVEDHFFKNIMQLEIGHANPIEIKIPNDRELNIFCNEFIQYRDGFIINAITTRNPIDIDYNFYFIDLTTDELNNLILFELDTIESVIVKNDKLIAAGISKGKRKILCYGDHLIEEINLNTSDKDIIELGEKSWMKLGTYGNELFALQNNGLFIYNDSVWNSIYKFSLSDLCESNKVYSSRFPILPTETPQIIDDKMFFYQEIVQGRSCNLFQIDLIEKTSSELFNTLGLIDNSHKVVNSYTLKNHGIYYLVGERYGGSNFLINIQDSIFSTLVYDNRLVCDDSVDIELRVKAIIDYKKKT
jgi:hypothetical protein